MPSDVSALEPANLTDLIGKFTALCNYSSFQLAKVESEIVLLYARRKERKINLFVKSPGVNQQEKWRRDAALEADEVSQQIDKDIAERESRTKIIRCYVEAYERNIAALSRDLTRRKL